MLGWILSSITIALALTPVQAGLFSHEKVLGLACALAARELFNECNEEEYACFCSNSLYIYSVQSCIGREAKYNSTIMGAAYDNFENLFCENHGSRVNDTDVFSAENQKQNPQVGEKSFHLAYEGEKNGMSQKAISAWLGVGMILYWAMVVAVVAACELARRFVLRLAQYRVIMKRPPKVERWLQKYVFLPALFGTRHMRRYEFLKGWVIFTTPTRLEFLVVAGYCLLVLIFMITPYTFMNNDPLLKTRWKEMMRYSSDRAGIIATVQFPLLILFALRNNIFIWLTGWSYSTFNTYHRAVARITYLLLVIHAILKHIFSASYGGSLVKYYYPVPYFRWGCASIGLFTLMIMSAVFRARGYEVFYRLHQLMAIGGLICAHYHLNGLGFKVPLWIAFALWGADWLIRVLRIILFNVNFILPPLPGAQPRTFATMRLYDGQLVRVSIVTPVRWVCSAGQYVYLHTSRLSIIGGHPFSVLGPNEYGEGLELVIKGREGMTRKLCAQLAERGCTPDYPLTVPVYVEGPYGVTAPVDRYEEGMFFAGGIGITGVLAYMEKMIASNKPGSTPKKVRLFWAIRARSDLDPVMHVLCRLAKVDGVELHIFLRQQRHTETILSAMSTDESNKEELRIETIQEEASMYDNSNSDEASNQFFPGQPVNAVSHAGVGDEAPLTACPASQNARISLKPSRFSASPKAKEAGQEAWADDDESPTGLKAAFTAESEEPDPVNRRRSFINRKSIYAANVARKVLTPHSRTKSEIKNLRRSVVDFVKARNPEEEEEDSFDYGRENFEENAAAIEEDETKSPAVDPFRSRQSMFLREKGKRLSIRHEKEQFIDAGFTDMPRRRMTMLNPFDDQAYPFHELTGDTAKLAGGDPEIEAQIVNRIRPVGMDIVSIIRESFLRADGSICIMGCGPDRMVDALGWATCQFLELAEYGRVDYFEEAFKW